MSGKKTTMKDVAKLAGVTQPTVSYVLNGTASISQEVRERVLKAVEELHYRPNYNAVALKTQRTNEIGIVIPDITNAFYSSMVSLLERELTKTGYLALVGSTEYQEKNETELLEKLLYHNVDAFIIAYELAGSKCWKLLKDSGKKVVTIEAGKAGGDFPGIETDNFFGAYTAVRHFYAEGRKKVAYIGQNSRIEALNIREKAYIEAVKESGIQAETVIMRTNVGNNKWMAGINIAHDLLKDKAIDAILVSSDEIAVGIIKTLISSGIRIPQDISLIGYDNIPVSELYIPELSTVAQPMEEICTNASKMISMLLAEKVPESIVLKPRLLIRRTTLL